MADDVEVIEVETRATGCGAIAAAGCLVGAIVATIVLIVVLFLVKILWAWTVPDLFPGAVEQGLIARDISWLTAFKVGVFVAVLAGIAGILRGGRDRE